MAIIAAGALGGCSTVMEANRPDPVNLDKYSVGEKRVDVIARLGVPKTTIDDSGRSCDVYEEYTKGVNKMGKGAIIFTEAAADILTLGLTEVVSTPAEAMTKNKRHTVFMCYDKENTLTAVLDQGQVVVGAQASKPMVAAAGPANADVPSQGANR